MKQWYRIQMPTVPIQVSEECKRIGILHLDCLVMLFAQSPTVS